MVESKGNNYHKACYLLICVSVNKIIIVQAIDL